MVVPLTEADAGCGAKAHHLGRLVRAGFPVPAGVVVRDPTGVGWPGRLERALADLGPGPFAVRSSAAGEDGAHASFAGQLASLLDVPAPDVPHAVRRVAASGSAPGVAAYADRLGATGVGRVCVLVQAMVRPDAAGVLFTRHPVTGARQVVVEATAGLGDAVVGGAVTPHRWVVDGDVVRDESGAEGVAPPLTSDEVRGLAATGLQVERLLGGAQDVEWAVEDGRTWLLQARPVTTVPAGAPAAAPASARVLVAGTPGSPGTAAGTARVVTGLDDFVRLGVGDVLVCRATSPAWTPVLARAAAVVTETGGLLAHAAIVARELGIPAVLAADGAMRALGDGRRVVVDGTRGTVAAEGAAS